MDEKKERTPEEIAAAKERMAKARAGRGIKKPSVAVSASTDEAALSPERLAEIKAEAAEIVRAERIKQLEELALKQELEALRGKAGQRTGNPHEDELVDITIDCGQGGVGQGPNGDTLNGVRINGVDYQNGFVYTVPRHMARSILEMMYRIQKHEHEITAKPLAEFYRKPHHTVVSPRRGVRNAPVIDVGPRYVQERQ